MVTENKDNDIVRNRTIILFDGDTVTLKCAYTEEANEELREFVKKKENYIDFNAISLRTSDKDAIQSLYAFTKILDDDKSKLTQPTFK